MAVTNDERKNAVSFRNRISILGIVSGSIVDIVGSSIIGLIVVIYILINHNLLSVLQSSPTELSEKLYTIIYKTDPILLVVTFTLGSLCSILGGYIAAWIANHDEILNGTLASILCLLINIPSIAGVTFDSWILGVTIAGTVVSPLLTMFGGFLRLKHKQKMGIPVIMDQPTQPIVEPAQESPAVISDGIVSQPKKSNKKTWIIVAVIGGLLFLCSIVCVATVAVGVLRVGIEKAPIESVLDSYMKCMSAKDVECAYALFSPRAQRQDLTSKLKTGVEGNNYVLFAGYQSVSVQNLNISAAVNTNPDLPQGTVATVSATITYRNGFQGSFDATLEKIDGEWKIYGIHFNVSPDKMDDSSLSG